MIVDGHEWTDDEVRQYAESERDLHDPARQEDNGYERCALCHYTRHPCSVYDLASIVLALLDRNEQTNWPAFAEWWLANGPGSPGDTHQDSI